MDFVLSHFDCCDNTQVENQEAKTILAVGLCSKCSVYLVRDIVLRCNKCD